MAHWQSTRDMCLTDVSDFQSQFSTKLLFLACSYFQIFEKNSSQTWVMLNISNNNNIHLYSAFPLVIQSALQPELIVISLIKYYNDLIVKHHCVLIIKIFKCHASEHILAVIKDEKLWRTKMAVSKCPCLTFMSYLDAKISLVRCICSSSYLQPYWPCNTHPKKQGHQATKIHTPRPLTYQLFFQNSSK